MYCTIVEVIAMIKQDMINVILGNEYIEDEAERERQLLPLVETAILDADAEINGYLAKRYPVPFPEVPQVIQKFSKDISVYNLISRTGIDESEREKTYLNRYNAAIKFLESVAKGVIEIGVPGATTKKSAATGFAMNSSTRLFSRGDMKGW